MSEYVLILISKVSTYSVQDNVFVKLKTNADSIQDHKNTKLHWIACALLIEQRNDLTNLRARQLSDFFMFGGYRRYGLKGKVVALLYPNPNRRHCGDIDLWVEGKRDDIENYIHYKGVRVYDVLLVHAIAEFFKDVPVEIHFCPSWMYNPIFNRKLQLFFASQTSEQFAHYDEKVGFAYPTVFFNFVHSMGHINRHVFEERIGLRQLMDYYYISKRSSVKNGVRIIMCYAL